MCTPDFTTPQKHCPKCGQDKPATPEFFSRHNKAPDGLNWWCKTCLADYQRQYRKTAHGKAKQEQYRTADKTRAYFRDYQRKRSQRPEVKAKIKAYNERPEVKEQQKENRRYRQSQPDKREHDRLRSHKYRTVRRGLPNTFTDKHWQLCLDYWHNTCAVCGGQLKDLFGEIALTIDHWISLSDSTCPGTTPNNMLCLCNKCNGAKHAKTPDTWLIEVYGKRKARGILERINAYFEWITGQEI